MLWYLTRSTGIVAGVLAMASLIWGLRFSGRNTGSRLRPNWWMSMHKWLGGMTLAATVVHVGLAVADSDSGIGIVQALVPNRAVGQEWAMTWGVLAMYLFAVLVLTSVARVRRRIPRRVWHAIHLLSFVAVTAAAAHALMSVTDTGSSSFVVGFAALIALAVSPLTIRLLSRNRRRHAVPGSPMTTIAARAHVGVPR